MFVARVPVYGDLRFKDRTGRGVDRGISVGKEWKYRSFVEGGRRRPRFGRFTTLRPSDFPRVCRSK